MDEVLVAIPGIKTALGSAGTFQQSSGSRILNQMQVTIRCRIVSVCQLQPYKMTPMQRIIIYRKLNRFSTGVDTIQVIDVFRIINKVIDLYPVN